MAAHAAAANLECMIDIVFVEAREKYQYCCMQRGRDDFQDVTLWSDFDTFWERVNRNKLDGEIYYYGDDVRVHLLRCAEARGHKQLEGVLRMLYGSSSPRLVDVQKCMQVHGDEDPFASLVISYHLQDVVRCFPKLFPADLHPTDVSLAEKLADITAVERQSGSGDWQNKLRDTMAHRLGAMMTIRDCLPGPSAVVGLGGQPNPMSRHIVDWCLHNSITWNPSSEMELRLKEICAFYTRDLIYLMVDAAELLAMQEEQWKDEINCLHGLRKSHVQKRSNTNKFGDSELLVSYAWGVAQEVKFREDKTTVFLFPPSKNWTMTRG